MVVPVNSMRSTKQLLDFGTGGGLPSNVLVVPGFLPEYDQNSQAWYPSTPRVYAWHPTMYWSTAVTFRRCIHSYLGITAPPAGFFPVRGCSSFVPGYVSKNHPSSHSGGTRMSTRVQPTQPTFGTRVQTTAEATAAVGHTRAGVSVAVRSACAGLPLKPFCTRARCRCVFPGSSARNSAELEDEQSAPISHACVQQRELLVPGATTTTTTTPAVLVRYLQLRAYSSPHH